METNKLSLICEGSKFEGTLEFSNYTRFQGFLSGRLKGLPGSHLIIGENGVIEGEIEGDIVVIDGYVRGNVSATTRVTITGAGRVIGEIRSPNICIDFGGYFDGKCFMEGLLPKPLAPAAAT